jgi:hypothetical protein
LRLDIGVNPDVAVIPRQPLYFGMAKRPQTPHRERDLNRRARQIVAIAIGEQPDELPEPTPPAFVKRGEARAARLTAAQRTKIAKKAARTRWHKEG